MEKHFSWAITKMFRNNIFITILFPRQLTCNRNARNARLLWKTNGTHCTHLIEGQVKIRSMHCKSNCNKNHHIYYASLFISTHTFKLKQNKMKNNLSFSGFSSDCIGVIYPFKYFFLPFWKWIPVNRLVCTFYKAKRI